MAILDNIIWAWKLDESSGNAADSSWNSKTWTNVNTVTFTTGLINNCAVFNGSNQKFDLPDNLGFTSAWDFSYSAWLWPDSWAIQWAQCPICLNDGSAQKAFLLSFQSGPSIHYWAEKSCVWWIGTYTYTTSTSARTHFVVTYSNWVAKLYINCVYKATSTNTWNGSCAWTSKWELWLWTAYRTYYKGKMDEVYARQRVLTDWWVSVWDTATWEIALLYNSWAGRQYPFSTTNIKSINWLAYGSIKSVNWLAIWSMKSFNWLA